MIRVAEPVAARTPGLTPLRCPALSFAWFYTSPNVLAVPVSALARALELGAAVLFVLLVALFVTELIDMTRLRWDFLKSRKA